MAVKEEKKKVGSLVVVGSGIRFFRQVTLEALWAMEEADRVLHIVDPATAAWIERVNPSSESLALLYKEGKPRMETYKEMIAHTLGYVRKGLQVCVVAYGHPGIFAYPTHESVRLARLEGYQAKMLPGISAQGCMFADLGIDPGRMGYQSFEATDFLIFNREFDVTSPLVLWQIHAVGDPNYRSQPGPNPLSRILVERLLEFYDASHVAMIYHAAIGPLAEPGVQNVSLGQLCESATYSSSTLFIPAWRKPSADPAMLERLRIQNSAQ